MYHSQLSASQTANLKHSEWRETFGTSVCLLVDFTSFVSDAAVIRHEERDRSIPHRTFTNADVIVAVIFVSNLSSGLRAGSQTGELLDYERIQ